MNNGNDSNPFISGIITSIGILFLTFFIGFYSLLLWLIVLIIFIVKKQYSYLKGMVIGFLISLFIFLIICGSFFIPYMMN